jgi:hypothetical protein
MIAITPSLAAAFWLAAAGPVVAGEPASPPVPAAAANLKGCTQAEKDVLEAARKSASGRVGDVWLFKYAPASTPRPDDRLEAFTRYGKLFFGDDVFTPDAKGQSYDIEGAVWSMNHWLMPGMFNPECLPTMDAVKKYKPKSKAEESEVAEIARKVGRCGHKELPYPAFVERERGGKKKVYICDYFFHMVPEEQVRTLVHEASHQAGVREDLGETYCGGGINIRGHSDHPTMLGSYDCTHPCPGPGVNVAENWSAFMFCTWLTGDNAKSIGAKPD